MKEHGRFGTYTVALKPPAPRQPISSMDRGERATIKPTSALKFTIVSASSMKQRENNCAGWTRTVELGFRTSSANLLPRHFEERGRASRIIVEIYWSSLPAQVPPSQRYLFHSWWYLKQDCGESGKFGKFGTVGNELEMIGALKTRGKNWRLGSACGFWPRHWTWESLVRTRWMIIIPYGITEGNKQPVYIDRVWSKRLRIIKLNEKLWYASAQLLPCQDELSYSDGSLPKEHV